jgi:DNA repair protein RecN (Recombination protein N)
MLTELRVADLGVIEELRVVLGPGMTALTGETGAGKTLLVEALQLVLGGRASPGLVRAGADEATVEARFVRAEPDGAETEVIVARAVPVAGRSRASVDGHLAPLAALVELAPTLVDIHGQHDQQSLAEASAQRRALDAFAGTDLSVLGAARARLADLEARLADLGGDAAARAREVDVLRYQLAEIGAAGLSDPDEEVGLAAEEERLADLAAHRQAAAAALAALDGEEEATVGRLSRAVGALGGRGPFAPLEARLRAAQAELTDVAGDLRRAVDTWEDDPAALAEIQARRRLLADLRHKYGPELSDVMTFADQAQDRLGRLEADEGRAEALQAELAQARAAAEQAALEVRQVRRAAAPRLAEAVGRRLAELAMAGARFEVDVAEEGAGDQVTLLLGANPGEPVQPLAKVASGGELARTMLALRLVAMEGPATMVFDEVDAGVGGAAARALARALHEVAGGRQVLVVTHLAQVAAVADHQLAVRKEVVDGRTVTRAVPLSPEDRVVEISRMLSGHPESATARAHAEELLALGRAGTSPGPSTTDASLFD